MEMERRGKFVINSEEPIQELPDLRPFVDVWLKQLDVDKSTGANYAAKILHFIKWFAGRNELKPSLLVEFDSHLIRSGQSDSNRHEIVRRCKQFFKWLYDSNKTPDYNLSKWFPKVSVQRELKSLAPIEAIEKLMRAAQASSFPERNTAMIALMLGSGVRCSECASIQVEDTRIDADGSGSTIVRKAKRVKGRKVHQRMVAFDADTGHYIRLWLDKLDKRSGPLWPSYSASSPDGAGLTRQGVYKVVDQCIDAAGLTGQIVGCHDLRRIFITHFRRNRRGEGHDKLLRLQIGHSSPLMTDLYDRSDFEDVREVIVSPLNAFRRGK